MFNGQCCRLSNEAHDTSEGTLYKSVAREHKINRNFFIREAGLVTQSLFFNFYFISVGLSLQSYQNPVNLKSWHSCSFQNYLPPERQYASRQGDKRSFRSYQNSANSWSWHSCRLQISELPKSCQWWELTFLSTIAFRATKLLST